MRSLFSAGSLLSSSRSKDGPWLSPSPGETAWTPLGRALVEAVATGREQQIEVVCEDGRIDVLSTEELLRFKGFPEAEAVALDRLEELSLSRDSLVVLDLGSGAGAHARELAGSCAGRSPALSVVSCEVSWAACATQLRLGNQNLGEDLGERRALLGREMRGPLIACASLEAFASGSVDCVLMMMNGLGLAGDFDGLSRLLGELKRVLRPGGSVLADGCDLRLSDHVGELRLVERRMERGAYFGQARMQLRFADWVGVPFEWLYVDQERLAQSVLRAGGEFLLAYLEADGTYLAEIFFKE